MYVSSFESLREKKSDSMHINKEGIIISYLRSGNVLPLKEQSNCKLLQKMISWF